MRNPPKPRRAYYVWEEDEGGDIYFLHSPNQMREGYTIERCPEYDDWVEIGFVPAGYLWQFGNWLFNCWECDRSLDDEEEEDDEGEPILPPNPVFMGSRAFCCPRCLDKYDTRKQQQQQAREAAKEEFQRLFPGTKITSAIVASLDPLRVDIYFKFPGGKGQGEWSSNAKDEVGIQKRDIYAWKIYRIYRDILM